MIEYKKVGFYTLGCKLNFSETSTIGRSFQEAGYAKVDFDANPDVFVINTCSVTENADKKCRQLVKRAIRINPNGFVAIIGCFAQLKPKEIASIKGVDIVLGTDAGAVPNHPFGYTGHRELEIYVRLGMSPMQALVAATSNAAKHLGLNDMGMLSPGYSADFIILDENPLDEIRNTRTISSVYLSGKEIDRSALQKKWRP